MLIPCCVVSRESYNERFQGAPELLVEEPRTRGTAPAILHALMRLYELAPSAIVGLFPSDHYIGNEARFVKYADSAFDAAADSDDAVILLGAEAKGPEQAYGWIEPETSLASAARLFSVRRFVEKPDARLANELWRGADVLARLYDQLPISGFSELILQRWAANLLVMPMRGVEWCDLGEPGRVMQVVRQIGVCPQWAVA